MTLISILMPVRNEEQYLAQALASIIAPAEVAVEVVLVDDGSTDNTFALARQIAAARDDLQIMVLEGDGRGKASALNIAWRHALGDVVVILAGDDLLVSELLPTRAKAVLGDTPLVAQCRYRSFSDDPRYDGTMFPRAGREGHLAGGATSFNRAFANLYFPVPEELPNEDTWLRGVMLLFGVPVMFINAVGLHYRIHAGNSLGPNLNFPEASARIGQRHAAFDLAMRRFVDRGTAKGRAQLAALAAAEHHRAAGRWWRLVGMLGLPRGDRAVFLANALPSLYRLKRLAMLFV